MVNWSWSSARPACWWQSSTWTTPPRSLLLVTCTLRSCCCCFVLRPLLRSPPPWSSAPPGSPALWPPLLLPQPDHLPVRLLLLLLSPPASSQPSWLRNYPRILFACSAEELLLVLLQVDWELKAFKHRNLPIVYKWPDVQKEQRQKPTHWSATGGPSDSSKSWCSSSLLNKADSLFQPLAPAPCIWHTHIHTHIVRGQNCQFRCTMAFWLF